MLWLAPFYKKGGSGEWMMLGFHFALAGAVLALA